jgi:hypothetical protein
VLPFDKRESAVGAVRGPADCPFSSLVEGESARFVAEFRPAHGIAPFFRELFALAAEGRLDRRGNPRPAESRLLIGRCPEAFSTCPSCRRRSSGRPRAHWHAGHGGGRGA